MTWLAACWYSDTWPHCGSPYHQNAFVSARRKRLIAGPKNARFVSRISVVLDRRVEMDRAQTFGEPRVAVIALRELTADGLDRVRRVVVLGANPVDVHRLRGVRIERGEGRVKRGARPVPTGPSKLAPCPSPVSKPPAFPCTTRTGGASCSWRRRNPSGVPQSRGRARRPRHQGPLQAFGPRRRLEHAEPAPVDGRRSRSRSPRSSSSRSRTTRPTSSRAPSSGTSSPRRRPTRRP